MYAQRSTLKRCSINLNYLLYDLVISQGLDLTTFSRATSRRVKWLKGEKIQNKSQRFEDHLCPCPQVTDAAELPIFVLTDAKLMFRIVFNCIVPLHENLT